MFDRTRHFAPRFRSWNTSEVKAAIEEIAADAIAMRDPVALWPSHPMGDGVPDGLGCLYFGAAGVILSDCTTAPQRFPTIDVL